MNNTSAYTTQPLFTIIIPTKDRGEYLRHTLRTCTLQDYEPLEVIVSDDGSTDNTRQIVEEAARLDPRIRYTSTGAAIGMRDNFERALSQVRPGYVIALGGDDGLLPGGIAGMHEVLGHTGLDLLTWPAPVYSYPNDRGSNGQLVVFRKKGTHVIDSHEFLRRQARNLHYLSDPECPMFYVKGVVSTDLVNRVRARSPEGRFYSPPTPDGYSGIVLAGEVPRYAFSARPFSIYGLSPSSQGQAYLSNDEQAKKVSQQFIQGVASRPMHRDLASQPYSPLITLMTADYLLTAKDLPGWPGQVPQIDFRHVLRKGIKELSSGLYGDERILRELRILDQIAEKHELRGYFRDEVRRTPRQQSRAPFNGTGINANAILLDGPAFGLRNIFDASYAAQTVYQAYLEMTPASLVRSVARSFGYRWRAVRRKSRFPQVLDWTR